MRIIFFVVVLAAGLAYSYVAFANLEFLTSTRRLGPGFFPRLIGVLMVGFTIFSMATEVRRQPAGSGIVDSYPGQAVLIIALGGAYVAVLQILGGVLATVVFLAVVLSILNSGRPLQNGLVAVLVPAFIYLLFDILLNAGMPQGMLPLPF